MRHRNKLLGPLLAVLRRIVGTAVTLLVASFFVYGALYVAPGSPISFIVGGHPESARTLAAIRAQYHLNDSFFVAYARWLDDMVHARLGSSVISRESVSTLIANGAHTTVFLVIYASVLIFFFGVVVGVVSALYPRRVGASLMVLVTIGMSTPTFVVSIVLITVFAVDLRWFPALGAGSGFIDQLRHLTLPAIALAAWLVAYVARITKAAVSEELARDHVMTARARGLSEWIVIRRHVLRNSWIPISTVVGLSIGALIAGDVIVEQAFGLNGIGALLLQSVIEKDFPVVQSVALLMVIVFVVINTLIDVGYVLADPRVRKRS